MAGPLLGLLAMGGALAARPHLEQYENRVAGRAFDRAMQGVDQSDPGAVRRAMGSAGLMDPSMVMGDLRTEFEGVQNRAQREAASRRSAGVARQNYLDGLAFQREQWEYEINNRAVVPESIAMDAAQRGEAWLGMSVDERTAMLNDENTVRAMQDALHFADQTTAGSRVFSREDAAYHQSNFTRAAMPFIAKEFAAGAMSDQEMELFERLSGDPFAWNNFTNAERGKVTAIIDGMQMRLQAQYRARGLAPQNFNPVSGLIPLRQGGIPGGRVPTFQERVQAAQTRADTVMQETGQLPTEGIFLSP